MDILKSSIKLWWTVNWNQMLKIIYIRRSLIVVVVVVSITRTCFIKKNKSTNKIHTNVYLYTHHTVLYTWQEHDMSIKQRMPSFVESNMLSNAYSIYLYVREMDDKTISQTTWFGQFQRI